MTSRQSPPVQIRLLGTFEVRRGDRIILPNDWTRKKAASLMKRLALERRLLKDQAIEFLWPGADPSSGANKLYNTLHILRQTLDKILGEGTAATILRFEDGILSLATHVGVDVHKFERLCAIPSSAPASQRLSALEEALDLYQGELLPDDRYEAWTALPRAELFRLQREARLSLAAFRSDARDFAGAAALLTPLLTNDPADESVHRALMRTYALSGQRHKALRQYQACVDALSAELGVSPAPETEALYSQIVRSELDPHPTSTEVELSEQGIPGLPPAFTDKPRPLFVGRERELSHLRSHLQAAVAGDGRIIFIAGEAGQGKTMLMDEFAYRAQSEHPELVVAAGACQAITSIADPYLPFRDLIAMLSGDWQRPWLHGDISSAHMERLRAIAPHTRQAARTVAPDLMDVIMPQFASPQPRDATRQNTNQRQIFDQMGQLLRMLARRQPLLLLLDDLQWADSASLNLLFHLGRQLATSPILIVGAYRSGDVSHPSESGQVLATVVQELIRYRGDILVDLGGAPAAEGRRFVDALLDSEPNRLDASFRETMFRRTKGHPLFTVELLRALQEQGDLVQDANGRWTARTNLNWDVLPVRVEAVINQRIARLPEELKQLLAVASVEGESFTVEVLAQVLGVEKRPLLHSLSQELGRRYGLVHELGEMTIGDQRTSRFQFHHNLFQQYLYRELSNAERQTLHGDIAASLEKIGGGDDVSLVGVLAHHHMEAGNITRAIPYLHRAGDEARRRVALDEASRFYRLALEHWQWVDAASEAEVFYKLAETLLLMGNSQEAVDHFLEAERLYALASNNTGRGAVLRLIGRAYWEQGDRARAMSYYQQALAILEREPPTPELARAISAISQMYMTADAHDDSITWGERALSLAKELQAEDVVVHTLVHIGISYVVKGEVGRGLALLVESQERAEELDLHHDACRAYTNLGDSLVWLERYDEARANYERMLAYARRIGAEMFEGVALVQLGYLQWWTGNWMAAQDRRQEIVDWMETTTGSPISKIWASTFLGWVYNDLGQPDKAREVLSPFSDAARSANEPQTTITHLAQLARAAQSEQERAALVQDILVLIEETAYLRYEAMPALRFASVFLIENSGDDTAELNRLEKIHEQAQRLETAASLHEVRAFAASIRGERAQAVFEYEAAAQNWKALQRPLDYLRMLVGMREVMSSSPADDVQEEDLASIRAVQEQATTLINQLARELTDPELQEAFLASPLVSRFDRV